MPAAYSLPWALLFQIGAAMLMGERRSFREDSICCVARLRSRFIVFGEESLSSSAPCVLTVNHYARPGFRAWWIALSISAVVPWEIHWLITAAWTYPDWLRAHTITPLSRWLLSRIARVYGFTNMPPMPPDPKETLARAEAVRRTLKFARHVEGAVIGMAPEGGDFAASGELAKPPSGAGRFILLLSALGLAVVPVGIFEEGENLCLRFGKAYDLEAPPGLSAPERDGWASQQVMQHIAELLPLELE